MIEIDGSRKSGSGTIVRDAVPFAALLGEALHLTNIRAKRDKPGLRPQHLKGIEAAARLSGGRVEGAEVGSREIRFFPGETLRSGRFEWDIETAGSATMMMLSLFPLALFAGAPSVYTVKGGLFQDFAPPALHTKYVLLPVLRLMGVAAELEIIRPGYVPKGGGLLRLSVDPWARKTKPLTLEGQGPLSGIEGVSLSSRLRIKNVADRMARECRETLARAGFASEISVIYDEPGNPAFGETAIQAGAALAVWARTGKGCRIGADMAGAPGRPAEKIGSETALRLIADLGSRATADRHLADQLIPFAALAEGTSIYRIPAVTDHVEARLWLVESMLGAKTELSGNRLVIHGIGFKRESL